MPNTATCVLCNEEKLKRFRYSIVENFEQPCWCRRLYSIDIHTANSTVGNHSKPWVNINKSPISGRDPEISQRTCGKVEGYSCVGREWKCDATSSFQRSLTISGLVSILVINYPSITKVTAT